MRSPSPSFRAGTPSLFSSHYRSFSADDSTWPAGDEHLQTNVDNAQLGGEGVTPGRDDPVMLFPAVVRAAGYTVSPSSSPKLPLAVFRPDSR